MAGLRPPRSRDRLIKDEALYVAEDVARKVQAEADKRPPAKADKKEEDVSAECIMKWMTIGEEAGCPTGSWINRNRRVERKLIDAKKEEIEPPIGQALTLTQSWDAPLEPDVPNKELLTDMELIFDKRLREEPKEPVDATKRIVAECPNCSWCWVIKPKQKSEVKRKP